MPSGFIVRSTVAAYSTPPVPSITIEEGIEHLTLKLGFDDDPDFIGYQVQRSTDDISYDDITYPVPFTAQHTKVDILRPWHWKDWTATASGTTYYYKVRAVYQRLRTSRYFRFVRHTQYSAWSSASSDSPIDMTTDGVEYFVATDGDDTLNDGLSVGNPFLTLQKAWDMGKTQREAAPPNDKNVKVNVAAGTYRNRINATSAILGTLQTYWTTNGAQVDIKGSNVNDWNTGWSVHSGDTWKQAWTHKYGYKVPLSGQGALARARERVFVNGEAYTPFKADHIWTVELDEDWTDTVPSNYQQTRQVHTISGIPQYCEPDNLGTMMPSDGVGDGNHVWDDQPTKGPEEFSLRKINDLTGGVWDIEVTRQRNQTSQANWLTAEQYAIDCGTTGHTISSCTGLEKSFFVDEENEWIYIHMPSGESPNDVGNDVEIAERDYLMKFSSTDNLVFKGFDFSHTIEMYNTGGVAMVYGGGCSNIWFEDSTFNWSNYNGLKFAGDTSDDDPNGSLSWITYWNCKALHCGGNGLQVYRCVNHIMWNCEMNYSNERGALGSWRRWNVTNKSDQNHRVLYAFCQFWYNKGDALWFDLAYEDLYVEDCLFIDPWRYWVFMESSQGPIYFRRNTFCQHNHGNVVDDKIGLNVNSNFTTWEDNLFWTENVYNKLFRAGGEDNRWHEVLWNSNGRFQILDEVITQWDSAGKWCEIAGDHIEKFVTTQPMQVWAIGGRNPKGTNDTSDPGYTLASNATLESGDTRIYFNETVASSGAGTGGVLRIHLDLVPGHVTFRRNIARGFQDALVSYNFISGGFYNTNVIGEMNSDWCIWHADDEATAYGIGTGTQNRQSYTSYKADVLARGGTGGDANSLFQDTIIHHPHKPYERWVAEAKRQLQLE